MKSFRSHHPAAFILAILAVLNPLLANLRADPIPNDGTTDATAAIQAALDDAGKAGGEVYLPPGRYLIAGKIDVPSGVTLRGSWQVPPFGDSWMKGSTLVITGGKNTDTGAAVTLEQSAVIEGFTFVWPEQIWSNIVPFPWAIFGNGMQVKIENITMINPYQAIKVGDPNQGSVHYIRNVFGCPLRYGVFIDKTHDIGRIENVHFNINYWLRSGDPSATAGMDPRVKIGRFHQNDSAVTTYQLANLEGFVFGRTDWEYVLNTFVIGAHIGYHFIRTADGIPNGQFSGIGSDWGPICMKIEALKPWGIMVTNGEFNNTQGAKDAAIITTPDADGTVQFANCSFWQVHGHGALLQGHNTVKFTSCAFNDTPDGGTIVAENGKLIVDACSFDKPGMAVVLKPGVLAAVVSNNLQTGGVQIDNEIGGKAQIGLNETP